MAIRSCADGAVKVKGSSSALDGYSLAIGMVECRQDQVQKKLTLIQFCGYDSKGMRGGTGIGRVKK